MNNEKRNVNWITYELMYMFNIKAFLALLIAVNMDYPYTHTILGVHCQLTRPR